MRNFNRAGSPRAKGGLLAVASLLVLSGCAGFAGAGTRSQVVAPGEVPVQIGTPVRDNRTPMDAALGCFATHLASGTRGRPVIAVGDIKDFTGKYSINEGNAITQGGALMVTSALGKLSGAVAIAERFDPVIAERELGYTDRRQLGDGQEHQVNGARVPWLPYFGGTIKRSDYFIVGGITELNYNIRSGGGEVTVNGIGPRARVFTQSVAVDLRIVDTRTLMVVDAVSLTKQFSGYEVGAGVFRFFGTDLFDINVGGKGQEPLQLGVRAALEEATMRLVGAASGVDALPCLQRRGSAIADVDFASVRAEVARLQAANGVPPRFGASAGGGAALNRVNPGGEQQGNTAVQLLFEVGEAVLAGQALAQVEQIAASAAKAPVEVQIVAREVETFDPAKRAALADQRIAALAQALEQRGLRANRITVTWRPDRAEPALRRIGGGLQQIAVLRVG